MSSKAELTRQEELASSTPRSCTIANALAVVGERWSLLIVRELLLFGVTRFNDIQAHTGAPRQILAARLRALEEHGVLVRTPYQQHPARYDYRLTTAGAALRPVLTELGAWGERFGMSVPNPSSDLPEEEWKTP